MKIIIELEKYGAITTNKLLLSLKNVTKFLNKYLQYCAKVMQMIIDEYRDISAIFTKILP